MIVTDPKKEEGSGHWYTRDGSAAYQVQGKNGKWRNTTLKDARNLNLVPSVTTILKIVDKPGLTNWLIDQAILASLTLPRRDDEVEEEYLARIKSDAKEQGLAAASLGTDIHAAIEKFYEGKDVSQFLEHAQGTKHELDAYFGLRDWICERSFGHELGFGGKVDMHCDGIVVDIKTKDFTDPAKVSAYDEHLLQLAAYRVGLGMPEARCANIFVSRAIPGLCKIIEWDSADLNRGWAMFLHLLRYWQLKTGYE
jgi:hypothetical protein